MKTLFDIDSSGSVKKNTFCHNNLKKIIDQYYTSGDIFYLWNSKKEKKNKLEIEDFIAKMGGYGGASSELIANIIKNEKNSGCEHLVIVTDGQVKTDSIDESDRRMDNYGISRNPFTFVSFYIIGDKGDLSVSAPYCRNCPNNIYHINSKGTKELVSVEEKDINILNNIHSIKEFRDFISKFNSLARAIQEKMLGSNADSNLENKLVQLKD